MNAKSHEELDVQEMERMVARALMALLNAPGEPRSITLKALIEGTGLPKRRVREVVDGWGLRTVSGDAYLLTPHVMEQVEALLAGT